MAAKRGETGIRTAASRDGWLTRCKDEHEKVLGCFVTGDSSGGAVNLEGPVRGARGQRVMIKTRMTDDGGR